MPTLKEGTRVVYAPGFSGSIISEEGRELSERLKKPVHGTVGSVGVDEVYIHADCPQDSGWFPASKVDRDFSEARVF